MIALDAMGGDYAPQVTVLGALHAAKKGIPVLLFGDEKQLKALLNQHDPEWNMFPLYIEHASEVIGMADEPTRAVARKSKSSLMMAINAVVSGRAKAIVSAGNSGATLVAATLHIGRVPGVLRPAIGDFLPTKNGSIFCIDLGANTDCKPEYLYQFAQMGHSYVALSKGIERPSVALLSNGSEPYKGSNLVKNTYAMLHESDLNFVGNLESRDMFDASVDVLVCDGFAGNILLKTIQGTAHAVTDWLRQEAHKSFWSALYLSLGHSLFRRLKEKTDYSKKGGALLLGVESPVVIAHGCSHATAIEHAIIYAHHTVQTNFVGKFNQHLQNRLQHMPSLSVSDSIHVSQDQL